MRWLPSSTGPRRPGALSSSQRLISKARDRLNRLPKGQFESAIERTLLEQRAYQRRNVFDEIHVRGTIGVAPSAVAHLPTVAAQMLPLFRTTDVRMLVEVHPPQDDGEPFDVGFRAR